MRKNNIQRKLTTLLLSVDYKFVFKKLKENQNNIKR